MTKLYSAQTGQPIEVAEDQVPTALQSGQYGLPAGGTIHVQDMDGQIKAVPIEQTHNIDWKTSQVVSQDAFHKQELHEKYGGLGQQALTAAQGLASGATLGFSDDALKAMGVQGVEEREEENPWTYGLTNVAGAVLPSLVGDEAGLAGLGKEAASAVTEGAEAAKGGSSLLGAAKTAAGYAPANLVSGAGHAVESGIGSLLGAGEGTGLRQLAKKAIAKGAGLGTEGLAYGVSDQLHEDILGDHELNGEKLYASGMHGAAMMGALGAFAPVAGYAASKALNRAGEASTSLLGRMTPTLNKMADTQAFRSLGVGNLGKRFLKQADRVEGGAEGIGNLLRSEGYVRAGDSVEQIADKVAEGKEQTGQVLNDMRAKASEQGARVNVQDAIKEYERAVMPKFEDLGALGKGARKKVEDSIDTLRGFAERRNPFEAPGKVWDIDVAGDNLKTPQARKPFEFRDSHEPLVVNPESALGKEAGELPSPIKIGPLGVPELGGKLEQTGREFTGTPFKIGTDTEAFIKPEALTDEAGGIRKPFKIGENVEASEKAYKDALAEHTRTQSLSLTEAAEFRQLIDSQIKDWSNDRTLNPATEALRKLRGVLEGHIEEQGEKAAQKMGGSFLDEYKAAKLKFQRLAVADKIAQDGLASRSANRLASPSDMGVGGAVMAGVMASHGPVGMLAGAAAGAAHHFIRERGNAYMATYLGKLAALQGIERAGMAVDRQIDRAVSGLTREEGRVAPEVRELPHNGHPYRDHADAILKAATAPDAHRAVMTQALSPLTEHAPKIAAAAHATAARAIQFLADKVPHRNEGPSIAPHLDQPRLSKPDEQEFLQRAHVVHDPVSAMKDLADGKGTRAQVETLKAVYPELYGELTRKIAAKLADRTHPIDYAARKQIALLFGAAAGPMFDPKFIGSMQSDFAAPGQQSNGPKKPSGAAPKRKLDAGGDDLKLH